jgi:cell volume regulation protein A
LLSFGSILDVGSFCGLLAQKVKVPDIVLFLHTSIVLGLELSGILDMKAGSSLIPIILMFGSRYILFDGGASLRFKVLKEVWITTLVNARIGVLITAGMTAATAFYVFKVPFITSPGRVA